ncbi:MAG TPA: radical SAM protein, partial [Chloroflexia bacterium]|nr:radical SAM protein [Chloroflexia bacterium]
EKHNWVDSGDFEMMYRGAYGSEFYRKLHVVLHKEYRAHKIWLKLTNRALVTARKEHKPYPLKERLRDVAHMVFNRGTLPIERRRLNKLARKAHSPLGMLPQIMTPEAAANPTPQHE